jgi:hypothetical protein
MAYIPSPFDAIPTLTAPPEEVRETARVVYPTEAVPVEGPIPDPMHSHETPARVTVPEWAMHAARWRLGHADAGTVDRWRVREFLSEYAQAREQYYTPDGRDAVAALLDEVDHADV